MLVIACGAGDSVVVDDTLFITVMEFDSELVELKFWSEEGNHIWRGKDGIPDVIEFPHFSEISLTKNGIPGKNELSPRGISTARVQRGDTWIQVGNKIKLSFRCDKKYKIWRKELWDKQKMGKQDE